MLTVQAATSAAFQLRTRQGPLSIICELLSGRTSWIWLQAAQEGFKGVRRRELHRDILGVRFPPWIQLASQQAGRTLADTVRDANVSPSDSPRLRQRQAAA